VEDLDYIKKLILEILINFTEEKMKEAIKHIIDNKKGN